MDEDQVSLQHPCSRSSPLGCQGHTTLGCRSRSLHPTPEQCPPSQLQPPADVTAGARRYFGICKITGAVIPLATGPRGSLLSITTERRARGCAATARRHRGNRPRLQILLHPSPPALPLIVFRCPTCAAERWQKPPPAFRDRQGSNYLAAMRAACFPWDATGEGLGAGVLGTLPLVVPLGSSSLHRPGCSHWGATGCSRMRSTHRPVVPCPRDGDVPCAAVIAKRHPSAGHSTSKQGGPALKVPLCLGT